MPSAAMHSPVSALSAAVRRLERRGRAGARAGRTRGEGDRCRHQRAGGGRPASRRRRCIAADFDPAELERIEERLFALRAAARKYSTSGRRARRRCAAQYAADVALIDAGAEQLTELEAGRRRGRQALRTAAAKLSAARATSRPTSSTRRSMPRLRAAEAGAREIHRRRSRSDPRSPRPAGLRSRRVLGADQSRHQAGAADEGRLRRRAVALPAGAESRAGGQGLGADAGVRRNRYRRRRRGGGCDRRAAGAARRARCR